MINYKSTAEVELIRQSCILVNDAIAFAAALIKPGISTLELNDLADKYIVDHGGVPNFKNY
ncbi:MAG: type I methionyl aminopeptidase, partial [Ginsengibacter sp.]